MIAHKTSRSNGNLLVQHKLHTNTDTKEEDSGFLARLRMRLTEKKEEQGTVNVSRQVVIKVCMASLVRGEGRGLRIVIY